MSEPGFSRVLVMGDDLVRLRAASARLQTGDLPSLTLEGPTRMSLASLRGARDGGLPPVRLKWGARDLLSVVTATEWVEVGLVGKCSKRQLAGMARAGEAGLAGTVKALSRDEFPDLYFLCGFVAFESWLVCWHLIKAGVVRQGGAWQRPNVRHNQRYIALAERWAGCTPDGDALLSDWGRP